MQTTYFGTDGIRGKAGVYPLDVTGATAVGKAVGVYFARSGGRVLVGSDPRESSSMLVDAVSKGLAQAGVNMSVIGVIPTPGLAYVANNSDASAAVMISASHNPYYDNGIKIFSGNGDKLSDEQESEISKVFKDISDTSGEAVGNIVQSRDDIGQYIEFLKSKFAANPADISIVIDCANGATSSIAQEVFTSMCSNTTVINNQPDGKNINDKCGATDTAMLQQTVVDGGHDLGIAFDGDGDRLILVDHAGEVRNGDQILYILGTQGEYKDIVATTMSNLGLEKSLEQKGIQLHRTDVGDRYVLEEMDRGGYKLGGEQSGHLIIKPDQTTGDGMLAAIKLLAILSKTGLTLAELTEGLRIYPQAIVNVELKDKSVLNSQAFADFIQAKQEQIGSSGRIIIRPSGTEPLLRVMIESENAATLTPIVADEAADLIKKLNQGA